MKEPRNGNGNYPVKLYFLVNNDDFVHPLCESQWRHDPRSRSLVFAMSDKNHRTPKIISFSDFRMPEKKEEE